MFYYSSCWWSYSWSSFIFSYLLPLHTLYFQSALKKLIILLSFIPIQIDITLKHIRDTNNQCYFSNCYKLPTLDNVLERDLHSLDIAA